MQEVYYLRSGSGPLAVHLERLLDENRAALCGVALAEVRQGLRPHEEAGVLELFDALPYLETTREDYDMAGVRLARLRRQGITLPIMDGLIAQLALRHEVLLLENDRHFSEIEGLERLAWREDDRS